MSSLLRALALAGLVASAPIVPELHQPDQIAPPEEAARPPDEKSHHHVGDLVGVGLAEEGHPLPGAAVMHQKGDLLGGDLMAAELASHGHPVLGYMTAQSDHERANGHGHGLLSAPADSAGASETGALNKITQPPDEKSHHRMGDIIGIGLAEEGHPLLGAAVMHHKGDGLGMDNLVGAELASHGHPVLGYMVAQSGHDHEHDRGHRRLDASADTTGGGSMLDNFQQQDTNAPSEKHGMYGGGQGYSRYGEGHVQEHSDETFKDLAGVALAADGHPLMGMMAMHEQGEGLEGDLGDMAAVGLAEQGHPGIAFLATQLEHGREDERVRYGYEGSYENGERDRHRWLSEGLAADAATTKQVMPEVVATSSKDGLPALTSMGMAATNQHHWENYMQHAIP